MTIIRFPGSVGFGNSGIKPDSGPFDMKRPGFIKRARTADMLEISPEAKERFNEENLVRLDRIRLRKEAESYKAMLAEHIEWKGGDMRNVYRLRKMIDAKVNLAVGVYDNPDDAMLTKMLDKPEI
jgi:hypothetical protein